MNTRFFITAYGLGSLLSMAAYAQTAASSVPPSTPEPFAFQSALQGYQPHTDEKIADWKAANETTARVGGWRVYAKEASSPSPTTTLTPPAVPATDAAKP